MFFPVVWIVIFCHTHTGHGENQYTRTRYMSGRNQIFGGGYSPSFDTNQNYIPFVRYWEKPLQQLESSMNVPKKLSSRPLFSWDVPVSLSTYIPSRRAYTVDNSIESSTEMTFWSTSNEPHRLDNEVVAYTPRSVQSYRSDRQNRAKDSVTYRSSYVHNSNPTKKKKSNNRKKSIDGYAQSKGLKWKEGTTTLSPNSAKFVEETNTTRKKLEGKKRRKGRKGKKNRVDKQTGKRYRMKEKTENVEGNDINVNKIENVKNLSNKSKYLHGGKILMADQRMGTTEILKDETTRRSPCETMDCEHTCNDENGKAVCVCYKGFEPVGTKCFDINECEINKGGCNGKCINTLGSRLCLCSPGYRLIDGFCADISECLLRNGHGPCQDRCTNTLGSYECSCEGLQGTTLAPDKHTCQKSNECNVTSAGCSHSCIGISSRVFCTCPDGFELGMDWKTCHDIDECSNPEDYNVECRDRCINTPGSYRCAKEMSAWKVTSLPMEIPPT